MKPPEFEYVRPASLDDAIAALRSGEEAMVLAGGQSLVPLLNMRLVRPRLLVDIARIEELRGMARVNGTLRIGATATQRETEVSSAVADACPLLAQALGFVAHPQIRNRGTIGGSLAHADPAAELPAVVLLLDGVVHARGGGGERAIAAAEFFRSHLTTALEPDEVLTAVELPVSRAGRRLGLHGDHAPSRRLSAVRGGMPGRARRRRRVHGRPPRPVRRGRPADPGGRRRGSAPRRAARAAPHRRGREGRNRGRLARRRHARVAGVPAAPRGGDRPPDDRSGGRACRALNASG